MTRVLAQLSNWRLQLILMIGSALTTATTVVFGSMMTYSIINNYLEGAQDARVGREMDLADAFYNNKLGDISATARRLASSRIVGHGIISASQSDATAIQAFRTMVDNEISNRPPGTQRFVVITDQDGTGITGCAASEGLAESITCQTDWSSLPIVSNVLAQGEHQASTKVIPGDTLAWVGGEEQARIALIDTPKAAQEPFESREGTAGLALLSVAPVFSGAGEIIGSVLGCGHLRREHKKDIHPLSHNQAHRQETGLGLAIIHGIVKMHRGQISVQRKEGKGTTFTIRLPEQLPPPDRAIRRQLCFAADAKEQARWPRSKKLRQRSSLLTKRRAYARAVAGRLHLQNTP